MAVISLIQNKYSELALKIAKHPQVICFAQEKKEMKLNEEKMRTVSFQNKHHRFEIC